MIKKYKSSIKKELLKIILSIVVITTTIGYIIFIFEYMKKEQNQYIALTKVISKIISQNIAKLVFYNDISTATDITTAFKAFKNLDEVVIYNSNAKIIFEYSKKPKIKHEKLKKELITKTIIKNGKLEVYDKLYYKGVFIAYVKYIFRLESIQSIILDSLPYIIIILIIMLLLAYILSKYEAEKFTSPIIKLVDFLDKIIKNRNFLHNRIKTEEKNEFGLLYDEVNTMLDTIEYSLTHDHLTGLYNRNLLINEIYRLQDQNVTIMIVDIKGFKELNDIYGNKFGDKLLIEFAKTLKNYFNKFNKIYRVGGNEFSIIFNNSPEDVIKIANNFLKYLNKIEFKIEGIKVNISVKIAINNIPPLLENADLALKLIKKESKSLIQYKESFHIKEEWQKNIEITNMVKCAIKEDRIVPYFQGIVNLKTLKIEKYECLVRLILPDGKVLSPYFFLDVISKTSYYYDITKIMIRKAIETTKKYSDVRFSINFSMKDIINEEITNLLFELFDEDKKTASKIDIEFLETELISLNDNRIYEFIEKVHSYGSKILIDDFGTGYSNFSYLIDLNVDIIKIDASITKEIISNPKKLHILKTIYNFSKGLNIKNVAEFVESKEIALLLQKIGVEYAQGYFFSKPASKPLENNNVNYKLRSDDE